MQLDQYFLTKTVSAGVHNHDRGERHSGVCGNTLLVDVHYCGTGISFTDGEANHGFDDGIITSASISADMQTQQEPGLVDTIRQVHPSTNYENEEITAQADQTRQIITSKFFPKIQSFSHQTRLRASEMLEQASSFNRELVSANDATLPKDLVNRVSHGSIVQ